VIVSKNPVVSVLITVYNRENFLVEAIESVLQSDFDDFELVIVDDCSSDNSAEIALKYQALDNRIKVYINDRNLGDYPNRNKAATYARGKYLKYVDSDDKIFPETLKVMVEAMNVYANAGFGMSSRTQTHTRLFSSKEAYHTHFFERGILDLGPTGSIISREKFFSCGGFKEIRNVSDFDFWLRMALKYPVLELPKGLVYWREHNEQEIRVAPEFYLEHTLPIILDNLNHKDCPLTGQEKKMIIKKIRKGTSRNLIRNFIEKKQMFYFIKTWKRLGLKLSDMF